MIEREFAYSESSLTQQISKYYGFSGSLSERWITKYDQMGRVHETWGLTAAGDPLGDGLYRHEYDDQGRKSRILSFNDWGTDCIPNSICVIEYDSDEVGNWVRRRKYHQLRDASRQRMELTNRTLTYWEHSCL
ncbi:hypothetical protein [Candidatus Korobacter versatilis]|uniref:hypothetical protein n=1 Tax=Candidatus Korobacter versatilis TaxID=658062 RepID=UPI0005A45AA5|nr:hypothetical protein [Candidatus Koribacter versatilis]